MNLEAERLRNPLNGSEYHQTYPRGERKLVPGCYRSSNAVIRLQKPVWRSKAQARIAHWSEKKVFTHTTEHSRNLILLYTALLLIILKNMKNTTHINRLCSLGVLEAGREKKVDCLGVPRNLEENAEMCHKLSISVRFPNTFHELDQSRLLPVQ